MKTNRSKLSTPARYGINLAAISLVFLLLNSVTQSQGAAYYSRIIVNASIFIILAVSLNLTTGFLGQLPLGHAGFMAVGAYTSAILTRAFHFSELPVFAGNSALGNNLEFCLALLLGGLLAAVFGILVGLPALRLRGDYLAIITLGFGEIIVNIINNLPITGGAKGMMGIEKLTTFPWAFGCVVLTLFVITTLIRSSHGRAIISIRENELAAAACGVNVTYYKSMAFTLAAFFAGIAGGLYAHYIGVLRASDFGFTKSIEILVMVVLGGMGSVAGSVIAATVLTVIPQMLYQFSDYRMVVYSLLLIVVMIFKPSGLMGTYDFSLTGFFQAVARLFKKTTARKNSTQSDAPQGGDKA